VSGQHFGDDTSAATLADDVDHHLAGDSACSLNMANEVAIRCRAAPPGSR
jgi:hypothetical protein